MSYTLDSDGSTDSEGGLSVFEEDTRSVKDFIGIDTNLTDLQYLSSDDDADELQFELQQREQDRERGLEEIRRNSTSKSEKKKKKKKSDGKKHKSEKRKKRRKKRKHRGNSPSKTKKDRKSSPSKTKKDRKSSPSKTKKDRKSSPSKDRKSSSKPRNRPSTMSNRKRTKESRTSSPPKRTSSAPKRSPSHAKRTPSPQRSDDRDGESSSSKNPGHKKNKKSITEKNEDWEKIIDSYHRSEEVKIKQSIGKITEPKPVKKKPPRPSKPPPPELLEGSRTHSQMEFPHHDSLLLVEDEKYDKRDDDDDDEDNDEDNDEDLDTVPLMKSENFSGPYGFISDVTSDDSKLEEHEFYRQGSVEDQPIPNIEAQFKTKLSLQQDDREFIREGTLHRLTRRGLKPYFFHLFNDILIYSEKSKLGLKLHRIIPIRAMLITDTDDFKIGEIDVRYAFKLKSDEKSFIICAPTQDLKEIWVMDILKVIAPYLPATVESYYELSSKKAPIWVADQVSSQCQQCESTFSFIFRRHHCRKCGALVCGKCSTNRVMLEKIDEKNPVRICRVCTLK